MKRFILLLVLGLAACVPNVAPPAVPGISQPTASAYIDPSYPTAQAALAEPNQTMNGIDVRMERVWRDGKNVNADVCFTMPDASDWSIWSASLNYSGAITQEYGTTLVSLQPASNGQAGRRCDTLTFVVPPDADLSAAVITIDSIAAAPRADEYCSVYLPKIQQALLERGIGIVLECVDVNGTLTMQIVSKPPEMSQEQAEQIVYSDEFYTIKGPWTFSFNLPQ
jgi:hypothetical protein